MWALLDAAWRHPHQLRPSGDHPLRFQGSWWDFVLRCTRVTFMSPLWQPQCSGQERGSLCSLTPRPTFSGSYGPASAFVSARSPPRPAPTRDVPPAPRAFPRPALASVPRPILACCPHTCPCEWLVPPLHPWLPLSDIKAPHVHLSPLVPAKDQLVQRKCCLLAQDTCPTSRVPGPRSMSSPCFQTVKPQLRPPPRPPSRCPPSHT